MDKTSEIEYIFISDTEGRSGIKPLPATAVSNHIYAPRTEFGQFYWQHHVLTQIVRENYDAVIFFAEIPALSTWLSAILARLRRKPVLFWTTGWHRPERGIKRIVRNTFYRLSNELLLYGELGRSIGIQMKYPPGKMTVIGNSVETEFLNSSTNEQWEYEKAPDTLVVGAVIRLIPVKELDLIIQAVSQLTKSHPSMKIAVLIVGEGPEREYLEALAKDLDVELSMPGAFYSAKVLNEVYEALDITVVPAAVGLTAIQSMHHGVPVISNDSAYTQMPEWESIKPGKTGELFQEGDVEGLADAIRRIAQLQPEERLRISQNCKDEVDKNWTATIHAGRIKDAIANVIP